MLVLLVLAHDCSCIGHGDDDGGSSGDSGGVLSACADVDADVDASASPGVSGTATSERQVKRRLSISRSAKFRVLLPLQLSVRCFFSGHEKSINASDGMDGEIGSLGEARPA